MKANGTQRTPRSGTVYKAKSQSITQGNQAGFEQILKVLMNASIFPMINTFSKRHFWS